MNGVTPARNFDVGVSGSHVGDADRCRRVEVCTSSGPLSLVNRATTTAPLAVTASASLCRLSLTFAAATVDLARSVNRSNMTPC